MCKLDDKIFENFKEIAKRLSLMYKELVSTININSCECKALIVISNQPNITQTKLSQICGIDKPATSRLINKLLQEDLVKKDFKDNNKKNTYLSLTQKGEEKTNEIKKQTNKLKNNFFNELDINDKENIHKMLNKLLDNKGGNNA